MILELLILIAICFITYQWYVYKKLHHQFQKNGIKYKPGLPIFGNTIRSTLGLGHVIEDIDDVCKEFPDERYVGYMEGMKKVILVKDPELMKIITVKDFDHFMNRKNFFPKEIDPLLGSSVLLMEGEEWRDMRSLLTPAFVSSKMRHIMSVMVEIANHVVDHLKNYQSKDTEVTEILQRYNTDVITSSTIGVRVNSVKEERNEFYRVGQLAVNFTFWRKMYYFWSLQFPNIAKTMQILGIPLLSRQGTDFFRKVVADMIEYRKKHKVVRADFIHLVTESSKGFINAKEEDTVNDDMIKDTSNTPEVIKQWTLDQITGQVFFAFIASFETSSSIMSFCIHELALHPEYEERLYQEIKAHHDREGELNYDNIADLEYLTCVLNETSRKWSAAIVMDRVCTKPYELPPPRENGLPYKVSPGDMVYNVVNSTHLNPKYHPDPLVFNPERFSVENKHKIKPFTYMPFGMGPRNCIGSRYEIQNMKVLMYHIVLNYKIVRCAKTQDPIRLQPSDLMIKAVGGTYVRFEARN